MVFFLATLVTAAVFITDRMEGVWERTLVAGKKNHNIVSISHNIHFLNDISIPFSYISNQIMT